MPSFSPGGSICNAQYGASTVYNSTHFAAATKSNGTGSTSEVPVFIPKDPVQVRFAPSASGPWHENMEDKVGDELETV